MFGIAIAVAAIVLTGTNITDSSRQQEINAIIAEYHSARNALFKQMREGTIKSPPHAWPPEYFQLQGRFVRRAMKLLDTNVIDKAAIDAVLFCQREAEQKDPKLDALIAANADSPDPEVRALASFAVAEHQPDIRAEPLLERIIRDKDLAEVRDANYFGGSPVRAAKARLFEIRHLQVGKQAPDAEGEDLERRPMKLSECRGKVTFFVFWATWCGPCMAAVPYELELVKRYASRPFAVVGMNGDGDDALGPRIQAIIKREGMTWRSFRGGPGVGIAEQWNVHAWPCVWIIDHQGVIRVRFMGMPANLDPLTREIDKLVAAAESDQKRGDATTRPLTSRRDQFMAMQNQFRSERAELFKAMAAGKLKKDERGGLPEYGKLQEQFTGRVRKLIDEDPADDVTLDAILFSMNDLVADASDASLYDILLSHHLSSSKLTEVVGRDAAPGTFLKVVIDRSPHEAVRDAASLTLARRLWQQGHADESERLLDRLQRQPGSVAGRAEHLLFEVHNLSIGKVAPEIEGWDLDRDEHGKLQPMKLSDYRGKVIYLVFWATWCGPCMAMVPHERELMKRLADRPFAIVGVGGEGEPSAAVRAIIRREGITWHSFQSAPGFGIADRWNVTAWPTVYLIDHRGIIRDKFHFVEKDGVAELDEKIEKLVFAAEADRRKD